MNKKKLVVALSITIFAHNDFDLSFAQGSVKKPNNVVQKCTESPPQLVEPANNQTTIGISPTLKWRVISGISRSRLQLSTDSNFVVGTVTIQSSHGTGPFEFPYFLSENLLPNTKYYWRVASGCNTGEFGSYSLASTFVTAQAGGIFPNAPFVLQPKDEKLMGSIRLSLTFSPLDDGNASLVQVYATASDASANVNVQGSCGGTGDYLHPAICYFSPERTYFWRVKLRNTYGWGELSSNIGSFRTPKTTAVSAVTPESGGQLSSDGNAVNVVIPPGAVTATTTLSYTMVADPQQSRSGFRFAGRAFELKAISNNQQVTSFPQPFTLTVQYEPADLLFEKISSPLFLNLYFWRDNAWQPILPCDGCFVDAANNRIVVVLDHLTEFMLAAPTETKTFVPIAVRQ